MPAPVSKKQYRYMMAILHGKKSGTSSRGDRVPASVAAKYVHGKEEAPKSAPDSKGKAHEGGKWNERGHAKAKDKSKEERIERKKKKAKLRKAAEIFIESCDNKAAGCLVLDDLGRILLGKRHDNGLWATPGGSLDESEDFQEAALRELREEAGIVGKDPKELIEGKWHGYHSKTFLIDSFRGKVKSNGELLALKWFAPHELPWDHLTTYSFEAIKKLLKDKLTKSLDLKLMLADEELEKRAEEVVKNDNMLHMEHKDMLKLVGNGTFRMLREAVEDMTEESHKEIKLDHYIIEIRKHVNDTYSGRVSDGHKQIHQFTNKSLRAVAADLMSVFEWFMPEDEIELEILEEHMLPDDSIEGGINELIENYRKHNIVNIYTEMENIREEIRNGMAVDLQQVEQKIMKLFDKLEENVINITDKHNLLNSDAGKAIDELQGKLILLQNKIDELSSKPTTVQAYAPNPSSNRHIHEEFYPYLSRPQVSMSSDGKISISFASDWTHMDRENFLQDMKARVVKKAGK